MINTTNQSYFFYINGHNWTYYQIQQMIISISDKEIFGPIELFEGNIGLVYRTFTKYFVLHTLDGDRNFLSFNYFRRYLDKNFPRWHNHIFCFVLNSRLHFTIAGKKHKRINWKNGF